MTSQEEIIELRNRLEHLEYLFAELWKVYRAADVVLAKGLNLGPYRDRDSEELPQKPE